MLVGTVRLIRMPKGVKIQRIAIKKEYRGQGIGRILMLKIHKEAVDYIRECAEKEGI
jgi:ribosomal protein S18 acetylase RimI-like enzyme